MTKKEFTKLVDKHLSPRVKPRNGFGATTIEISGIDKLYKAMNFTRCCMGEAEQLSDKPIYGGTSYNDL
jgi:hypothetical protein